MAHQTGSPNEGGQVSLTDFPDEPDEAADPLADLSLPERDFVWEDEITTGNGPLSLVFPNGDISLNGRYLAHQQGGLIVDGTEAYLDEYADQELEIPATYTAMDDFPIYVGMATTLSSGYGLGINGWLVEMAIRFATGGGRYNTDDLTLIACGVEGFVLRAPDGDFLFTTKTVREPRHDDYEPPRADVGPISIEEDTEHVIEGMTNLLADAETYLGLRATIYEGRSSTSHRIAFEGSDEQYIRVSGTDAGSYSRITTDPADVLGDHEIETAHGEHYECLLDELEYEVGEDLRDGICVGYSVVFHDPRESRRASMSGRIKARINYHYLRLRDTTVTELDAGTTTETFAEFKPESKDYNPIGSHL